MFLPRNYALTICLTAAVAMPVARANNIVLDFSNTNNPNGVWSYYYGTSSTTQTEYTSSQGGTPIASLPSWYNGGGVPDAIYMVQNTTGSTVNYLTISDPTGTLWLDPEEYSVAVVFTAPAAGTYNIEGDFLGIDTGENSHPVEILLDGTAIYSNTISSYGEDDSFNFSKSLNAGDTLSFYVGTGSAGCSYCNLSTGLDGTVTAAAVGAVPEPSLVWLCAGVFLSLLATHLVRRMPFRSRDSD